MNRKAILSLLALLAVGCVSGGGSPGGNQAGGAETCGPANCAGCCSAGVCLGGNSASACGSGGGVCGTCSSPYVCLGGASCGVDPESVWLVQPSEASIASTDNGEAWDSFDGSAPDVVVTVTCPPSSNPMVGKTNAAESYTPAWSSGGCTAKAKDLLAEPVTFTLDDNDPVGVDSVTGQLSLQVTAANLANGKASYGASAGMTGITFELTKK